MTNSNKNFTDYAVFTGTLNQLPNIQPLLINTINQYSYCVAEEDSQFKAALQTSDILLPDGIAIVWAMQLLNKKKIKKIAGADLHQHLLADLNLKGGSCFYLGASEATLEKIKSKLAMEYPGVRAGSYSPPFKPEFNVLENEEMITAVNNFKPDVLFIGMTAPKQEKWAVANKSALDAKIICTIGAVFDFYAGTVKRPHQLWINLGLEWLVRLLKEPKRLWRRYVYYGPVFIWKMLQAKAKQ